MGRWLLSCWVEMQQSRVGLLGKELPETVVVVRHYREEEQQWRLLNLVLHMVFLVVHILLLY